MELPDVRAPSTPEAIRGQNVHSVMEDVTADGLKLAHGDFAVASVEHNVVNDPAVHELEIIMNEINDAWGGIEVVEAEVKRHIPTTFTWQNEDGQEITTDIVLSGMIDGVWRMPDGTLVIVELKTGSANDGKLSRTRKELCFYRKMLIDAGVGEANHYLIIFPDADNPDFLTNLINKRGTEVYMGMTQGLAVMQQFGTRTLNSFQNSVNKFMQGITGQEWPIKWNEYFCTQWCDFHLACNDELAGLI